MREQWVMSMIGPNKTGDHGGRDRQFVRQYLDNMRGLYSYIFAFVPNRSDADDIFQEVTVIMWQKYESFDTDAGFLNWAVKIARHKIKQHHQKQARNSIGQYLSALQPLDDCATAALQEPSFKQQALQQCINRLKIKDKKLLRLRYEADASTQTVSIRVGRSIAAVYKALNRIHYQLLLCIQGKLTGESQP